MTNDNFNNMFGMEAPFSMNNFGGRILTPACSVNTQARTPHNHNACIMRWRADDIISPTDRILHDTMNATMKIEGEAIKPKMSLDEAAPKLKEGFMGLFSEIQNALQSNDNNSSNNGYKAENTSKTDSNSGKVKVNVNADKSESAAVKTEKGGLPITDEFNAQSMHTLAENSKPKISKEVMDIIKSAASNGENTVTIINTVITQKDVEALEKLGFVTEEVQSGGYPDIVSVKIFW